MLLVSAQKLSLAAALRQNAGDPDADVEYLRALQETLEKVHEQH